MEGQTLGQTRNMYGSVPFTDTEMRCVDIRIFDSNPPDNSGAAAYSVEESLLGLFQVGRLRPIPEPQPLTCCRINPLAY